MNNLNISDPVINTSTGISSDWHTGWSDSNVFIYKCPSYAMEVKGNFKNILTDALSILQSKSKNITDEKKQWAQKVVDIHNDIEYYQDQLNKLNKEFDDLTKSQ